jgi:hypothetical protein
MFGHPLIPKSFEFVKIRYFPILLFATNGLGGVFDEGRDITDYMLVKSVLPSLTIAESSGKSGQISELKNRIEALLELRRMAQPASRLSTKSPDAEFRKIYAAAWRLALRAFNQRKDDPAREKLIALWNKGLKEDSGYVQISVLGDVMCRDLMNEVFWDVFNTTTDPAVLSAMGYLLSNQGSEEDIQKAIDKMKILRSSGNLNSGAGVLQNGINWAKYRLSSVEGSHEPPSVPPPGF